MKRFSKGDFHRWECNRCDSLNSTPRTRIENGRLVCGVCHAPTTLQAGERHGLS